MNYGSLSALVLLCCKAATYIFGDDKANTRIDVWSVIYHSFEPTYRNHGFSMLCI